MPGTFYDEAIYAEKSDSICCRTFLAGAQGLELLTFLFIKFQNAGFSPNQVDSLHYSVKICSYSIIKFHRLKGKNKGKTAQQM